MFENFISIMENVRKNILESFMIPGLNISYWDFCISLLVVGLVVTLLVNSVPGLIIPKGTKKQNSKSNKRSGSRGSSSSDNEN